MALYVKFSTCVQVLEKTIVNNRECYRIIMPSGLQTIAWASDLIMI